MDQLKDGLANRGKQLSQMQGAAAATDDNSRFFSSDAAR
jgi:hypothetical protein